MRRALPCLNTPVISSPQMLLARASVERGRATHSHTTNLVRNIYASPCLQERLRYVDIVIIGCKKEGRTITLQLRKMQREVRTVGARTKGCSARRGAMDIVKAKGDAKLSRVGEV